MFPRSYSVYRRSGEWPDDATLERWYRDTIYYHPDYMDGMIVFAGTAVPVKSLLEYLFKGCSVDDFLTDFPTVSHQQVKDHLLMSYEGIPEEWESVKFRALLGSSSCRQQGRTRRGSIA